MVKYHGKSKSTSKPVPVLVSYHPKPGQGKAVLALLKKHWSVLDGVGLVTKKPGELWRAEDTRGGGSYFVEMFEWKDEKASETAHSTKEVMAVWEAMGPILERLQIAHLEPVAAAKRKR